MTDIIVCIICGTLLCIVFAFIAYEYGLKKGQGREPIPAPCSHKWVNKKKKKWVRSINWSKYEYTVFIDRCEHCGKLKTTEI